jgi:hypothetical protein
MALSWNVIKDRAQPFKDEIGRIEFLFSLYNKLVNPLKVE